jgi:deazaflavin-dependent oxidoreductase (nitroreductase family)
MADRAMTTARAPGYVTLFNPLTRRLLAAGVPLGPNGIVTVRGRRSGIPRSTPVAVIETNGRRWIWSPWGDVHWVRNLREAGHATLTVRGRAEPVRASELDPAERVGFFRDVLGPLARSMRGGSLFIRLADRVDLGRPEEAAGRTAVFELLDDAGGESRAVPFDPPGR